MRPVDGPDDAGMKSAHTGSSTALVRRFEPRDLDAVLLVVRDTITISYAVAYTKGAIDFFLRYHDRASVTKDAEDGLTLVLEMDGRVVATGTLLGGEVKRVFVLPPLQGRGYGRMLMDGLMEEAARSGMPELHLHSSTVSVPFYLGLGFSKLADNFIDVGGGERLDYILMARKMH